MWPLLRQIKVGAVQLVLFHYLIFRFEKCRTGLQARLLFGQTGLETCPTTPKFSRDKAQVTSRFVRWSLKIAARLGRKLLFATIFDSP
jgi:hypothetical protein